MGHKAQPVVLPIRSGNAAGVAAIAYVCVCDCDASAHATASGTATTTASSMASSAAGPWRIEVRTVNVARSKEATPPTPPQAHRRGACGSIYCQASAPAVAEVCAGRGLIF